MKKILVLISLIFILGCKSLEVGQLEREAKNGVPNAQFILGNMYHLGDGVVQDYEKAAYWYEKAANNGEIAAQLNLGILYYQGKGVKKDYGGTQALTDMVAVLMYIILPMFWTMFMGWAGIQVGNGATGMVDRAAGISSGAGAAAGGITGKGFAKAASKFIK